MVSQTRWGREIDPVISRDWRAQLRARVSSTLCLRFGSLAFLPCRDQCDSGSEQMQASLYGAVENAGRCEESHLTADNSVTQEPHAAPR